MVSKTPIVVLSGASGSGKTTLCRMLSERKNYYYAISHTTRPQRVNEINGQHYFFINRTNFEAMREKGDFLEWTEIYGNLYGTSKAEVTGHLKKEGGVVIDVDAVGAREIKKIWPHACLIFILAPSKKILEERLSERGTESREVLQKRLSQAEHEEENQRYYDHVLVNHNLHQAYGELEQIIHNVTDQCSLRITKSGHGELVEP